MGNLIYFEKPRAKADYIKTQIHRALGEDSSYTEVETIELPKLVYFDVDGQPEHYYKVRFEDKDGNVSEFSDPLSAENVFLYSDPSYVTQILRWNPDNLPENITLSKIYNMIWDTSREIDYWQETAYGRELSATEIYNQEDVDVNTLRLGKKNIKRDSVKLYERLNVDEPWRERTETLDYEINYKSGKIIFYRRRWAFRQSTYNNIKVEFTYGDTEIPEFIKQYCAVVSAMKCVVAMSGGSISEGEYEGDSTRFGMGGFNFETSQVSSSIKNKLESLEIERKRLLKNFGETEGRSRIRID